MIVKSIPIRLKQKQELLLVPIGDVGYGGPDCDVERLKRLIAWCTDRKKEGYLLRFISPGDLLKLPSPSERAALAAAKSGKGLHETTIEDVDALFLARCDEFLDLLDPVAKDFVGIVSGHHYYRFSPRSPWYSLDTDQYLAKKMCCDWLGKVAHLRLTFPPSGEYLDIIVHHGYGNARTKGAIINKRARVTEGFRADIVLMGHDNRKFAWPDQVLGFNSDGTYGYRKVYYVATGSFEMGYRIGDPRGTYVEEAFYSPLDLGVVIFTIKLERRDGKYRLDYHASA